MYVTENKTGYTKVKRFLAFVFDLSFIALVVLNLYMLLGLFIKIDSAGYQNLTFIPLLMIIIFYLFFGEIIFRNTLGRYLLGLEVADNAGHERPSLQSLIKRGLFKIIFPVEGVVLLFSRSGKRLGDFWAKTHVKNMEDCKYKPGFRFVIGVAALVGLLICFRITMGLAVKQTDFYRTGVDYLKSNNKTAVAGLPKVVNQSRTTVNFIVPVSNENQDKYAIIYLEKIGDAWMVNKTDFTGEHILGFSYGFSYSSNEQVYLK